MRFDAAETSALKKLALKNGAASCAVAPAAPLAGLARFRRTLERQAGGVPSWLARSPEKRADIKQWDPAARSVLVCLFSYWNSSLDKEFEPLQPPDPVSFLKTSGRKKVNEGLLARLQGGGISPKISRYALSRDYHSSVRETLGGILSAAAGLFPGLEGKIFCDTSPVMEKELASVCGLGWLGRNTLLITPRGSWFFLGGISLNMDFTPDIPAEYPGCGSCRACELACPSGALSDGQLDISRCLSFRNTLDFSGGAAPGESSGWFYGCDECQKKCPFNEGAFVPVTEPFLPFKP